MKTILVAGGAGYIGSHTCVELLNEGYEVVIMDNLYNANIKAVERIEQITGKKVTFYQTDMLDREGVKAIFDNEKIDAVIHFAGLKAVGESVVKPIEYYTLLLLYMVLQLRSRLLKTARRVLQLTHMAGPSGCLSRY